MNTHSHFSYLKGYSFRFEDGPIIIEPWFSSWTGLEKIKVNDELIYEQRNLSKNSSTSFEIEGISYNTNLDVKSILRGPFVCSLSKNGKLFKRQQLVFRDPDYKTPWYGKLWFALLVGLLLGVSSSVFQFQFWIGILVLAVFAMFNFSKAPGHKPRIEEVEIEDT